MTSEPSIIHKRMKPGITLKLFFAILLTTVLASLAMLGAMHYSFHQGFLGYLNEQEAQRVESLLPRLTTAYREQGNWEFLRGKPRAWFSLIRPEGMPPPHQAQHRRHKHGERGNPPIFPESELTGIMLRLSLLDHNRQLVIGNPKLIPEASLKPIEVDGRTVGWIAHMPFEKVSTAAELRFQQQQLISGWVFVGVAILLAAIVAWLLARVFLAPLKRIATSTHHLATGDYTTRVAVSSTDELGRLAEDFNKLAVALERNEKLRRDFMADISHELRTPLSVLKGELEAVEDGVRPMSMTSIRSLQAEVATLGKLVDDLYELSLSDVGALVYRKSRVDVQSILAETVATFKDRFADKSIRIDLNIDPSQPAECDADPIRIQQLFTNLLENSARYTDEGGRLSISCAQGEGILHIDFQDTAPGVPADKLPHLFERFYRADHSRSRATGGSGLGLAISRNIVEAHQGNIAAKTSPLGGVWISVTLPLMGKSPS